MVAVISFYDNRANVVAICTVVERSNGTSEPEKDLFGTAYQTSSHFHVLTPIVQIREQENYSILLGIRLRASPNKITCNYFLFPSQGGIVEEEGEGPHSLGNTLDSCAIVRLG
jgi:hypothetical protein